MHTVTRSTIRRDAALARHPHHRFDAGHCYIMAQRQQARAAKAASAARQWKWLAMLAAAALAAALFYGAADDRGTITAANHDQVEVHSW